MNDQPNVEPSWDQDEQPQVLSTWARICLHGWLALIVLGIAAYIVTWLIPLFDFAGSRSAAVGLALLTILIGPPLLGAIVLFGLLPLLGRREGLSGIRFWDDRLFSAVKRARQKAQIVVIDWPNRDVRTMGILTGVLNSPDDGEQLATVYVPTAPQTRYGYIHVVRLANLEMTDWTLKEWQLYQLSFGAVRPKKD